MSTHTPSNGNSKPLDLSKWRPLPNVLMILGLIGAIAGFVINRQQFGFSWLLAFMFFLSLGLGGLGLTILHHLFDASWSVPIRRVTEQLGGLLKWMVLLWIPIGYMAYDTKSGMYEWIHKLQEGMPDHSTLSKQPLFTIAGFYGVSIFCLLTWFVLSRGLLKWSLKQDETGSVQCTRVLRRYAATGVFFFAFTLTFGAIMWVKALEHEWFSTMYGVYYFAGSMWITLATVYVVIRILDLQGPLKGYVHEKTYYFLGTLLFAFTVFYAYVTFAQYFIIWNANVPEETFWYLQREKGTWYHVGAYVLIFGHFFIPFLTLLRIDAKLKLSVMIPLFVWAWIMHFVDMTFNIVPVLHHDGFTLTWIDFSCWAFFAGFFINRFIAALNSAPILPQKDPRFAESQDIYIEAASMTAKSGGKH